MFSLSSGGIYITFILKNSVPVILDNQHNVKRFYMDFLFGRN